MKRDTRVKSALLPIILLLLAVLLCGGVVLKYSGGGWRAMADVAEDFDGGNGSQESPYLISNATQLDRVRNFSGVFDEFEFPCKGNYFRLTKDINLTEYLSAGGAGHAKWGDKGWEPIRLGASTFDGGGHTVRGLFINRPDERYVGLFSVVIDSFVTQVNVELSDKGIVGLSYAGGIAGVVTSSNMVKDSASVSACSVRGRVRAAVDTSAFLTHANAGLIVGNILAAKAENCYGKGVVEGIAVIGGIAGSAQYASVTDCLFQGQVLATAPTSWQTLSAGGIVGTAVGSVIRVNLFLADGESPRAAAVAGFNGAPRSDGQAIALSTPEIISCYYNADKFAGSLHFVSAENAFAAEDSRGLTDKELKDKNNFVGFDFDNVWGFDKGVPVLRAFANINDSPDLSWLWITLACVLGQGILIVGCILLYRRKKCVVVTQTVEVEREVVRDVVRHVPRIAQPLPSDLSPQERRVAELILQGLSRREIADKLNISDGAVGTYTTRIYIKSGVDGQREFVRYFVSGE